MKRTLEETIKYYSELAEENEKDAEQFKRFKATQDMISHCYECAKEHRQLADWLRELKTYKDFEDKGYVMCRFEVAQDDRHRTTKMVLDFSTRKLFDNIVEVKADERR